jgi:hypothetical protein
MISCAILTIALSIPFSSRSCALIIKLSSPE